MFLCEFMLLQIMFVIMFINNLHTKEFKFCYSSNLLDKLEQRDILLWKNKGEPSKYQDVVDYIKNNPSNDKLLEFEKKLKHNKKDYLIYKYRFKDGMTFREITTLLNIDNPRLVEKLDKIALALKLYCDIEN